MVFPDLSLAEMVNVLLPTLFVSIWPLAVQVSTPDNVPSSQLKSGERGWCRM